MNDAPANSGRRTNKTADFFRNRRVRAAAWVVVVLIFISGLVGGYHRGTHDQPDWRDFARESRDVWKHHAVPAGTSMFGYLPAAFFALWPFTVWLPQPVGLAAYLLANALAAVASCAILYRAWFLRSPTPGAPPLADPGAFVWPVFLSIAHIQHVLQANQMTLFVLLACVAGLTLLARGRPWLGGLALGLGTCLKVTPAVFLAYLCLRRNWKALAAMLLAILAFDVLPSLLVFGPGGALREHRAWLRRADWYANARFIEDPCLRIRRHGHNCSLAIVLARWLRPPPDVPWQIVLHGRPPAEEIERARAALRPDEYLLLDPMPVAGRPWCKTRVRIPDLPRFRLARLSAEAVRRIWFLVVSLPIAALLIATHRNRRAPPVPAEAALWMMLMLWPAPMFRDYYLALTLPAYLVVWRAVLTASTTTRGRTLAAAALAACYLSVLGLSWDTGTFYGLHLATLAGLAAACAWAWRRERGASDAAPAVGPPIPTPSR